MTILRHGARSGISDIVEGLHEGVFFGGGGAREEEPGVGEGAVLGAVFFVFGEGVDHEVVAFFLDVAEGGAAEAVEFEDYLGVLGGYGEVDITAVECCIVVR